METRGLLSIEITKGKNVYSFHAPVGAPYGEARDSLIEIFNKILNDMYESDKRTQEKMRETQQPVEAEIVEEN